MPSANLTEAIDNLNVALTGVGDSLVSASILLILILIPIGLTVVMFLAKQAMLGFPCAMFWAILGGYSYTQYTTAWVDWEYYLAWASLLGMTTFTALAAFGLREKRDTLADDEMDAESKETEAFIDEKKTQEKEDVFSFTANKPESKRTRELRERAEKRRSGERKRRLDL